MEFQRNILKVNSVTLTVTLLAAIGNVRCQSQFSHNYSAVQEQIDALTKARYLLFPHIYRAFIDAGRSPSDYNVSSGCQGDLTRYYWALSQEKAWAWRREYITLIYHCSRIACFLRQSVALNALLLRPHLHLPVFICSGFERRFHGRKFI